MRRGLRGGRGRVGRGLFVVHTRGCGRRGGVEGVFRPFKVLARYYPIRSKEGALFTPTPPPVLRLKPFAMHARVDPQIPTSSPFH